MTGHQPAGALLDPQPVVGHDARVAQLHAWVEERVVGRVDTMPKKNNSSAVELVGVYHN